MVRQLLFIQGGGACVHDEWDDKLVESLRDSLGPDWDVRYPRMPSEENPGYAAWKPAILGEIAGLEDGAIVVSHSVSAPILVNALAECPPDKPLGALILVSPPFVGEGGWPGEEYATPADLGARLPKDVPVHVFQGDADDTVPPAHADLYARAIPQASIHRLSGRDHQLNNDLQEVGNLIKRMSRPSS